MIFYLPDAKTGIIGTKYAVPDFAVYNTKTGQISKIVDAKNGNATLTKAQTQLNERGGTLKGTSQDARVKDCSVRPGIIEEVKTNLTY